MSLMDVIYERCAGLDIGKDEVTACVRTPGESGRRRQEIRTYPTFTTQLRALADWLTHEQVTQVVMEATEPSLMPASSRVFSMRWDSEVWVCTSRLR